MWCKEVGIIRSQSVSWAHSTWPAYWGCSFESKPSSVPFLFNWFKTVPFLPTHPSIHEKSIQFLHFFQFQFQSIVVFFFFINSIIHHWIPFQTTSRSSLQRKLRSTQPEASSQRQTSAPQASQHTFHRRLAARSLLRFHRIRRTHPGIPASFPAEFEWNHRGRARSAHLQSSSSSSFHSIHRQFHRRRSSLSPRNPRGSTKGAEIGEKPREGVLLLLPRSREQLQFLFVEGERAKRSSVVFECDEQWKGTEIEKGGIFGIPEIEVGGNDGRNGETTWKLGGRIESVGQNVQLCLQIKQARLDCDTPWTNRIVLRHCGNNAIPIRNSWRILAFHITEYFWNSGIPAKSVVDHSITANAL